MKGGMSGDHQNHMEISQKYYFYSEKWFFLKISLNSWHQKRGTRNKPEHQKSALRTNLATKKCQYQNNLVYKKFSGGGMEVVERFWWNCVCWTVLVELFCWHSVEATGDCCWLNVLEKQCCWTGFGEQCLWNSVGGIVLMEQCWWNGFGLYMLVNLCWSNGVGGAFGGTVLVKQCWCNQPLNQHHSTDTIPPTSLHQHHSTSTVHLHRSTEAVAPTLVH